MKAMQAAVLLILRSLGIELKDTVFFLTCLCLELSWKQKGGGGRVVAEKDFVGYTLYLYLENNSEYLSKFLEVKKDYKRLFSGPNN